MDKKVDYVNLMSIAESNLNNCINETMNLYKEKKSTEIKMKLVKLIYERKKLFLFDKEREKIWRKRKNLIFQ